MFNAILEKVVHQCPGGVGALVMGFDGIGIEQVTVEETELDLNLVGIEYSNVVKEIRTASELLRVGELQELSIKTGKYFIIIQSLTDEYFVALVIKRSGNFGKGRYLLMREAFELKKALE